MNRGRRNLEAQLMHMDAVIKKAEKERIPEAELRKLSHVYIRKLEAYERKYGVPYSPVRASEIRYEVSDTEVIESEIDRAFKLMRELRGEK
jgi:hypothetical protein